MSEEKDREEKSLYENDLMERSVPHPKYQHYQFREENPSFLSPDKPSGNHRKEKSFAKKAGTTVSLAVLFGLVAGVVFEGVGYVSDEYLKKEETSKIETTQSLAETSTAVQEESEETSVSDMVSEKGTVAAVAQATMPSVVAITSVSVQEIPSFFGTQQYKSAGSGSGIIVGENDDELLIATNNHVVDGASALSVCFIGNDVVNAEEETENLISSDGDLNVEDAVSAKIKGTDADNDLAVVAVQKSDIPEDTLSQIKIANINASDDLVVGEQVVAIGNALGYGQSVTSGWISALDRTITTSDGTSSSGLIQTDTAINPGNSGGALLNMQGELIGINSAKYADSSVEGMGYAIPISKAQPILQELMNRETRDKVDKENMGYLGVQLANITEEAIQMYNIPAGAFVRGVDQGGPAFNAGICKGDIIVSFDGQKISNRDDLSSKLQYYASGETVGIVVARADGGEYRETSLEITLGSQY